MINRATFTKHKLSCRVKKVRIFVLVSIGLSLMTAELLRDLYRDAIVVAFCARVTSRACRAEKLKPDDRRTEATI